MWITESVNKRHPNDKRVLTWFITFPTSSIEEPNSALFSLKDDSWITEQPYKEVTLNIEFECINEIRTLKNRLEWVLNKIDQENIDNDKSNM